MRRVNLSLVTLLLLMFSVLPPCRSAWAQAAGDPAPEAAATAEAGGESGSYRLDYVPLDNYKLERWGARRYTMFAFPRKLRAEKDVIIAERQRKRIGRIKLETVVKENQVIFHDTWGDPVQENGWADLTFVCKRDNLLSMQTMSYRQGGRTTFCDVTDGEYELEQFNRRRSGEWPEGTVTEASLLRIFTMLPRAPGISYSLDHYTVTPEFSPFATTGDAIVCHGPETIKINRMDMHCTKYTFRDMQAWVRDADDALVRFLVPGWRELVIAETPHEYAAVLKEAAEE